MDQTETTAQTAELIASFGLHLEKNFFDAKECENILQDLRSLQGKPASVYGASESGSVNERVRRTTRLSPSLATEKFVRRRLSESMRGIGEHFRAGLKDFEEPQFLRYLEGDFFVAHQDGNTGLMRLESDAARKVSLVIFLNRQTEGPEPGAYCGGSLVFTDYRAARGRDELSLPVEPGALVAFRAETTHEVTKVTHGERYTIACWYR
jgi:SM-20-related protein